ncbi:MAG: hypothetical protein PF484_13470 [Bacteroidales bacterium]|jgi:uncharacterized membrane protein (Fun14 family)|nr:hypothetical protein [Bacteroidales bacterium]
MKNFNKSIVIALILGVVGFVAGWQIYAPDLGLKMLFGISDSLLGNIVSDAVLSSTRTKVWIVAGVGALVGYIIGWNLKKK